MKGITVLIIALMPVVFLLGAFLGSLGKRKTSLAFRIALPLPFILFTVVIHLLEINQADNPYAGPPPAFQAARYGMLLASALVLGIAFPLRTWYNGFETWFARRITFKGQRSISALVVRLGLISIALGVAVMEISLSIVFGFQTEIQQKVVGFAGHVHVGNSYEQFENVRKPIRLEDINQAEIEAMPLVINMQPFASKPALLRSEIAQEGVFLKGVDSTYNWDFFEGYLKEGKLPDLKKGKSESHDILISRRLSKLLGVGVDETLLAFVYEDKMRVRKLTISGIYETGMEEFDLVRVICDMRMIQRLWRWEDDQVEGFEINLNDLSRMEEAAFAINDVLPSDYKARTVLEIYPEIFEWVELQHQNVWFILALMVIISIINMTSVILILILERTKTIGLLKAMGMTNFRVRRLFVMNAMWLILIGMAVGNLLGMGILWTQDTWGWLEVDQANYFVSVVPVQWTWGWFLIVNLGVFAVCTLFMYIPTYYATHISPVRILRFD